jgi:3-phosphoshikimate 1-carboxyvinyltransferase
MVQGLRQLGALIDDSSDCWSVDPIANWPIQADIDVGLAGTVMRFLAPVAALGAGQISFHGDPQASARPMGPLLQGLNQLGATITGTALPFTVKGPITGRLASIDASTSSQFMSALLLSGPAMAQGLTLRQTGDRLPSQPHIAMTIAALEEHGVTLDRSDQQWRVDHQAIKAIDQRIEADTTTAAAFLAAAAICGGEVTIVGWPQHSLQPGGQILDVLQSMGVGIVSDGEQMTVHGHGELQGVDVDLSGASELTPVVTALAALAKGPSRIRGVGHIRGHETDRIAALAREINALGGAVTAVDDGLIIEPRRLHAGLFHTYHDHRMAHAACLIGLRVEGTRLDDVACTSKTMPTFPQQWLELVG